MDCPEYKELLSGMLDAELTEEEFRQTKAHLVHCVSCQEQYREMQTFQNLFQHVFAQDLPLPSFFFPGRVRKHIEDIAPLLEDARSTKRGWFSDSVKNLPLILSLRPAYGVLVALLLFLLLGGYYAFWSHTNPELRNVYQLPTTSQAKALVKEEQLKHYLYLQQHALSAAENPLFSPGTLEYANQVVLLRR